MQDKRTLLTKLQNVQDELQALQRDAGPGATGRTSREMRQLENRLDKAVLKANEAQSIKCTYEQVRMVRRHRDHVSWHNLPAQSGPRMHPCVLVAARTEMTAACAANAIVLKFGADDF